MHVKFTRVVNLIIMKKIILLILNIALRVYYFIRKDSEREREREFSTSQFENFVNLVIN